MKKVLVVFVVFILILQFNSLAGQKKHFSLSGNNLTFLPNSKASLFTLAGRYWWQRFGIEGGLGIFTGAQPQPFYEGNVLFKLWENKDLDIYVLLGVNASGDEYGNNQIFKILQAIPTFNTEVSGYQKGLGVEFHFTESLTINTSIKHYSPNFPKGLGRAGGDNYELAVGASLRYYFDLT